MHKANQRLPWIVVLLFIFAACDKQPLRVACIGDSITEGNGLRWENRHSYPVLLDSLLGMDYTVLNCGRGSTTMLKISNFSYWSKKDFRNVFTWKPNIITIKLGTNDTKPVNWDAGRFERDYQAMIDTLETLPGPPKIYCCLPVPVYVDRWGINDSTMRAGVIPIIKRVAAANSLPVIDLNTPLLPYAADFPDGVHPNVEGALKVAQQIAPALTQR